MRMQAYFQVSLDSHRAQHLSRDANRLQAMEMAEKSRSET